MAQCPQALKQALKQAPNDLNALDTRAHIFEALGRKDEAIADFRQALAQQFRQFDIETSRAALKRLGAVSRGQRTSHIKLHIMTPRRPPAQRCPINSHSELSPPSIARI